MSALIIASIDTYKLLKFVKLQNLTTSDEFNQILTELRNDDTITQQSPDNPGSPKSNPEQQMAHLISETQFFTILEQIDTENRSGLFSKELNQDIDLVSSYYILLYIYVWIHLCVI